MKKFVTLFLVLTMLLTLFAGCAGGNTEETNETTTETTTGAAQDTSEETTEEVTEEVPAVNTDSLEEIVEAIYGANPVEFGYMTISVDLADTSEDGLAQLNYFTGLEDPEMISEAVVSEAAIGSIPFSLVLVRVRDGAPVEDVAKAMSEGINQRKWVCVEADDMMVVSHGDVVMLIMIGSEMGNARSFVAAFSTVVGEPEVVIE